jgi:hypothetical protein
MGGEIQARKINKNVWGVLAIGSDEGCGGKERAEMDRAWERAGQFIKGKRPSSTPRQAPSQI